MASTKEASEIKEKDDQMMEVINSSLNLISAVGSDVPLYGTMVATASSGITALVTAIGKKEIIGWQGRYQVVQQFGARQRIARNIYPAGMAVGTSINFGHLASAFVQFQ
mgnify:CR=1 FL=1